MTKFSNANELPLFIIPHVPITLFVSFLLRHIVNSGLITNILVNYVLNKSVNSCFNLEFVVKVVDDVPTMLSIYVW